MSGRLLIGLHHLGLGGSQLNALDLAIAARDRGHTVAVFGRYADVPGPVAAMAREAGLPVHLVRHRTERQRRAAPIRPRIATALLAAAVRHRAELVHAYEYPMILDAFHGPHLCLGVPLVCTVYAMEVPRWLPRAAPLVVGTRELVTSTSAFRAMPELIEPPVNTRTDSERVVDGGEFRRTHGIERGEIALVAVSRLEPDMKAEGIRNAIGAVRLLADPGLRLVVVGDGPSYQELATAAKRANAALGREAVVMVGALADPRPAYAAADIALGMGGSALRAAAFSRPVIVLGTRGFSRPLTEETVEHFLTAGFFGVGVDGASEHAAVARLANQIRTLAEDPSSRDRLGRWSRRLVEERFSLERAAGTLDEVYERALASPRPVTARVREAARVQTHRAAAELLPATAKARLRRVVPWR